MSAIGFSLNLVSLLAITLVTGILVDDAIVEIENIVRHMRMGKTAYRAALEAADEIGLAVIAISLSIAAIFAPVSFMGGIAGQYFRQFGLTVAIAVLFSLLGRALRHARHRRLFPARARLTTSRKTGASCAATRGSSAASVRHRWITLFVGALIFAASLWSTKLLPSGFLPADDQGRVLLAVELPPGSRLDDTDRVTRAISDKLRAMPEVRSALIFGGQILGGGAEPRKATFVINFVHKSEREATQKQLADAHRGDARESTRHPLLVPQGQRPARHPADHRRAESRRRSTTPRTSSRAKCATIPIIENPMSTAELDRPELRVTPRRQVAADLGVSTEALSGTIRVATLGDIDANLAKFNAGDRLVPIRVELDEAARSRVGLLKDLRVPTASGGADSALGCRRFRDEPRADRDQPLRSHAPRDGRGGSARRRGARRRRRGDQGASDREGSPAGRRDSRDRRCRGDGRGLRVLRGGDGRGADDRLRAAGALVRQLPAADHDSDLAAALDRRSDHRAAHHAQGDVHAGRHRHAHADGHRDQECDHAGRFRGRGDRPRDAAARSAGRSRTQARPARSS